MAIITVETSPFDDQKPGTSGLRKRVSRFVEPNYLENFVQAIFDSLEGYEGKTLVLGGDGRFHNDVACGTILQMAAANGFGKVIVGRGGILSTPAVSHLIRKYETFGGIILSASHNPGGPNGDFGIKFNAANGGPAKESLTEAFFARSKAITSYKIIDTPAPPLSELGKFTLGNMDVEIVDPVADYADMMEDLFDFDAIRALRESGFSFCFDAMHAVTGPYATEIFGNRLGFNPDNIWNAKPDESFGGGHPDPNLVHAKELHDFAMRDDGPDLAAASDGDGDRNLIIGKQCFVSPSDSLAALAANAHLVPAFKGGVVGVARSMPTSAAVDRVAERLGVECHETPTGWKFFGNLLDAGKISLCGEESAGTSGDHVREKDGVWAVLMWLNILAVRKISVRALMREHYEIHGRNYYARHDFEGIDADAAHTLMADLEASFSDLQGRTTRAGTISDADSFSYHDPIDGSVSNNQGLRVFFEDGSRIVYRLSGTGTVGATLRVYLERSEPSDGDLGKDVNTALSDLAKVADELAGITERTGRTAPDVIT